MDPGAKANIMATIRAFYDEHDMLNARLNIGGNQRVAMKNQVMANLFEYAAQQKQFLALYPVFRNVIKAKAEELLNNPDATEDLKGKAGALLNTITTLPDYPGYVAGGRRRRRAKRTLRKAKKSRGRSRRHRK
jgi:hypothetical protein